MNGTYLEAIRVHYGDFDELTDCKCIMGKLVARGLIDFHEKEELMLPSVTTAERNQKMLDFVRRKGNSKFDVLVQLLLSKECYKDFAISLHKACYGEEPLEPVTSPISETVFPVEACDDPNATHGRPKMSQLTKDLVPHLAARWKLFANIMDTPQYIIERINADNVQLGVESCCTEFLAQWLEDNPHVTWNDVIRGLIDIRLEAVAEELTEKYLN